MSSWLWGSSTAPQVQFDELVDQATSSDLPTPSSTYSPPADLLAVSLQLSDLLRSAQVTPPNALRAIKRRLEIPNPNVQLLAILLFDVLVKNSGDAFLKEASSNTPFLDQLGDLAKNTTNRTVQSTLLRCLQNWVSAFETKPSLASSKMVNIYRSLQSQGLPFPFRDPSATAAMIDSLAAPEWKDSDLCSRCRDPFSMTNRKHHCRNCGDIFDHKCSSKFMPLPHFGIQDNVRVCDGCAAKLAKGTTSSNQRRNSVDSRMSSTTKSSSRNQYTPQHRKTISSVTPSSNLSRREQEEEDLKLAMKLSLESAQPQQHSYGVGFRPNTTSYQYQQQQQQQQQPLPGSVPSAVPPPPPSPPTDQKFRSDLDGEDDPDLKAAIEASLQDAGTIQPSAPEDVSTPDQNSINEATVPPASQVSIKPPYELPLNDKDALLTFAQSVEALSKQNKPVESLTPVFENASSARPRLLRSLDDSGKRMEMLTEMHDKLHQAVKVYDKVLERQISRHTSAFSRSNASAPQPAQAPVPVPPQQQQQQKQPSPPQLLRQGSVTEQHPIQHQQYQPYPQSPSAQAYQTGAQPHLSQQQQQPHQAPLPPQAYYQTPSVPSDNVMTHSQQDNRVLTSSGGSLKASSPSVVQSPPPPIPQHEPPSQQLQQQQPQQIHQPYPQQPQLQPHPQQQPQQQHQHQQYQQYQQYQQTQPSSHPPVQQPVPTQPPQTKANIPVFPNVPDTPLPPNMPAAPTMDPWQYNQQNNPANTRSTAEAPLIDL